jgi:hypothetical protein
MWREILSFFNKTDTEAVMAGEFYIGESLVGEGNEIAHIDLIIGSKSGPAGVAFANALSTQTDGFNHLLAVVTPNLPAKPDHQRRQAGGPDVRACPGGGGASRG